MLMDNIHWENNMSMILQGIKGDDIGPFLIPDDANIPAILACEIVTTGIMCFFTNVMVGDKTYDQATGPMAIGITVFQGILAGYDKRLTQSLLTYWNITCSYNLLFARPKSATQVPNTPRYPNGISTSEGIGI